MPKFRKKPIIIEACQFQQLDSLGEVGQKLARFLETAEYYKKGGKLFIHTLEGDMEVRPGDWIIRGIAGEFYPCKDEVFIETYDCI